jgi:hypothetical protein
MANKSNLDLPASEIKIEPLFSLAAAMVLRAAKDLQDPDWLTALESLIWWLGSEPSIYLDGLGFGQEPDRIFTKLFRCNYRMRGNYGTTHEFVRDS